jgi:predicted HD phosphohydrolase
MGEQFRGQEQFEDCAEFCAKYDRMAFDTTYFTAPLEFFEPIGRRVMTRPINSIYATE